MTPHEKAKELVDKFNDYVHGYVGSSMLTNYEYPERILSQAKSAATIVVDEVLSNIEATILYHKDSVALPINKQYWEQVKEEINKL